MMEQKTALTTISRMLDELNDYKEAVKDIRNAMIEELIPPSIKRVINKCLRRVQIYEKAK